MVLPAPIAANILKKYYSTKDTGSVGSLKPREWSALLRVVRSIAMNESDRFIYDEVNVPIPDDFQFRGYKEFVREWAAANSTTDQVRSATMKHLVSGLTNVYGTDDVTVFANELGPHWASRMILEFTRADSVAKNEENMSNADLEYADEPLAQSPHTVVFDKHHGCYVDEHYPAHPHITPEVAWERYETGIKTRGIYPPADVIGQLIQALGRKGDLNCVHWLYNDGQLVLAQMNHEKCLQSHTWYSIENQIIIALAHARDIEGAHVHRQRIIDQGGTPSSDADGALIQCVKEMVDNSTNTLAFWQESQVCGVVANLYLYNTIISKLSKAHKADLALDLFKQMKANRIWPSSVTFGAIIAACCRVGDAQSTRKCSLMR
jgi:pentatricopeptide repeat protein